MQLVRKKFRSTENFLGCKVKIVKRCNYCGRESEDNVTVCSGCGLEISEEPISLLPQNFFQWKLNEWIGYAAAIPVAFVVSVVTFLLFAYLGACLKINALQPVLYVLVGFNGVFFGAYCFPRSNRTFRNRVFGSTLLLVVGLGFEILIFVPLSMHEKIMLQDILRDTIPTSIGGLAAVALHYWRKPRCN
jgi:hypothetical protein